MKRGAILLLMPYVLLIASCLPTPPPELLYTRTPQPAPASTSTMALDTDPSATPAMVEIGGRTVSIDKIVDGMLCDDVWSGTIYVTADVRVNPWVDEPAFLRECILEVRAGTVVYVAAHPGETFYKGCTCHE